MIELQGESGHGLFAMVDDEDHALLSRITWNITGHGYAKSTVGDIYMHVLVFGLKTGPHGTVDHHDRNRLNNQKYNLRHATKQRQVMNQGKRGKPASSIYKGVCLVKRQSALARPWQASITKKTDGVQKTHFCGYHATEEEAARAYDVKALELFGEYACINFPDSRPTG